MSAAIENARQGLKDRLVELQDETRQIEKALAALGTKAKKRAGRPAGSSPKAGKGKPRRRRKGGSRGEQAVKLVQENPGISAAEIAKTLKIKPNYMYRVLSDEVKRGTIKKKGRAYQPA